MSSESNWLPTADDLAGEPDGLADIPSFLAIEVRQALSALALDLGCTAAEVYWRARPPRIARWFGGSSDTPTVQPGLADKFSERPPGKRFPLELAGGDCDAVTMPIPDVEGEVRLVLFGAPPRMPKRKLLQAVVTTRFCVRMVRGARQLSRVQGRSASLSIGADMLSMVLQARSVQDTLGVLAERIALATSSESIAIDSYDYGNGRLDRNLFTRSSWPGWQGRGSRWRKLLEVRLRAWRKGAGEGGRLDNWRQAVVIPDVQNPMVLAASPPEEAAFFIEAGLRTAVLVPLWVGNLFVGVLSINNRQVKTYTSAELEVISRMADVAAVAVRGAQLMDGLTLSKAREKAAYLDSISRLAAAAEARDSTTASHLEHLQDTVRLIARGLLVGDEVAEEMVVASTMHDIGKISLPDSILLKPGPLTPQERELVKRHTVDGERLLTGSILGMAREVARSHHERWDGSGYPDGLSGAAIPLSARIVSVADVFAALISERPYKRPWPADQAAHEIVGAAGKQFDAAVVDVFEELWRAGSLTPGASAGRPAA